ncbi:MAG: macrolide family glycosyltransferase [Chitinophagales bacterium]
MSKVVFCNVPAHGHVNPTLAIVKELVNRGEEVIYYTSEEFKEKIERTGASFRSYAAPLTADTAEMTKNGFDMAYMLMAYNEQIVEPLMAEIKEIAPDYIMHDALCVWANICSQKLNIPAISSIPFLIVNTKSVIMSPLRLLFPTVGMMLSGFGSLMKYFYHCRKIQKKYGINVYTLLFEAGNYQELNISYTSDKIQPTHAMLNDSFKFVGITLPPASKNAVFPYERDETKKMIYISMGTVMSVRMEEFYEMCFDAFRSENVQVVLSAGKQTNLDDLKNIPDNFIVKNFVPQLDILQHTDVFISHGGMNSIKESFYYGVPIITIPQSFEQSINANRIEELKAGIYLSPKKLTAEKLRKTTYRILAEPKQFENVKNLKNSLIESGGYKRAVDEIFAFKQKKQI